MFTGGEDDLLCIMYTSSLDCTLEAGPELIGKIVVQSSRNNQARQIGGVLHYDATHLTTTQVLEGSRRAVCDLYAVICADPRHSNVTKLLEERRAYRSYAEFGMLMSGEATDQKSVGHSPKAELAAKPAPTGAQMFLRRMAKERPADFVEGNVAQAQLLRLTYRSQLAARLFRKDGVTAGILQQSLRNNPKAGIGGILFVSPDSFQVTQVLEGPPAAVIKLASVICDDSRHEHFKVVRQVYTNVRQ